jgi:poly-beta-1,6-N-acetyl-D-glucosamine N-deacetylase PgaB
MRQVGLIVLTLMATAVSAADVPVVVYHDIVREGGDAYAVREADFRAQMRFLRRAGYRPIRLADYARAAEEGIALPDKPVLLTFDDGLASFKDIVLPVLEKYGYPAVLAVTTGWLDGRNVPEGYRGRLLTAEALRAVSRSPLVEVISHTDQLHEGIAADPFGSLAPATVTRRYLGNGRYESEAAYRERLRADLRRSRERLTEITGKPPAGIAWPYGYYNSILVEEAAALGMTAHFALDDAPADTREYPRLNRRMLLKVRALAGFEQSLQTARREPPVRLLEISLDELAVGRHEDQESRLKALTERVRLLRINSVIVSPFTRDGRASFFATATMPIRADLLHRVLHQLRAAAGVRRLILRLPAEVTDRAAWQELARRHPYDDLLVSGAPTEATVQWLRETFGFHRPTLRCGSDRPVPPAACRDFRIVRIRPSATDLGVITAQTPADTPVYLLVESGASPRDSRLAGTIRALRQQGVRHYGIEQGPWLESPDMLQAVALELARVNGSEAR